MTPADKRAALVAELTCAEGAHSYCDTHNARWTPGAPRCERAPALWTRDLFLATLTLAKDEIREDVDYGVHSKFVPSFAALHDHVDANEYGGLCDDNSPVAYLWDIRDAEDSPAAFLFANALQDELDVWIKAGMP